MSTPFRLHFVMLMAELEVCCEIVVPALNHGEVMEFCNNRVRQDIHDDRHDLQRPVSTNTRVSPTKHRTTGTLKAVPSCCCQAATFDGRIYLA